MVECKPLAAGLYGAQQSAGMYGSSPQSPSNYGQSFLNYLGAFQQQQQQQQQQQAQQQQQHQAGGGQEGGGVGGMEHGGGARLGAGLGAGVGPGGSGSASPGMQRATLQDAGGAAAAAAAAMMGLQSMPGGAGAVGAGPGGAGPGGAGPGAGPGAGAGAGQDGGDQGLFARQQQQAAAAAGMMGGSAWYGAPPGQAQMPPGHSMPPGMGQHQQVGSGSNSALEGLVLFVSPKIDCLFTQASRPGRTLWESVGGIFEMDSPDWSNGIYSIPDPTLSLRQHHLSS